jgi:hypothetical protein
MVQIPAVEQIFRELNVLLIDLVFQVDTFHIVMNVQPVFCCYEG